LWDVSAQPPALQQLSANSMQCAAFSQLFVYERLWSWGNRQYNFGWQKDLDADEALTLCGTARQLELFVWVVAGNGWPGRGARTAAWIFDLCDSEWGGTQRLFGSVCEH
jgi:hypothetical protein